MDIDIYIDTVSHFYSPSAFDIPNEVFQKVSWKYMAGLSPNFRLFLKDSCSTDITDEGAVFHQLVGKKHGNLKQE